MLRPKFESLCLVFVFLSYLTILAADSHRRPPRKAFSHRSKRQAIKFWKESEHNYYHIITSAALFPLCNETTLNQTKTCHEQVIGQRRYGQVSKEERLRSISPYDYCLDYDESR